MPVRNDDGAKSLLRALRGAFADASFRCEDHAVRPWASITFTGARHRLRFRLEGQGAHQEADRFIDGLADREFALHGHIVADIRLVAREDGQNGVGIEIEVLTIEDA
jgi:hypothetical protein